MAHSFRNGLGRSVVGRSGKILLAILGLLIVLLLAARITAPTWVRKAINHQLASIEGYWGQVQEIDLHLWRGAYEIHGLELTRIIEGEREPLLVAREVDFSISWSELFKGRIRSRITADGVELIYAAPAEEEEAPALDEPDWQEVITHLFPIDIDHLSLTNARLTYLDAHADPPVRISLEELSLAAAGLSNRPSPDPRDMPASLKLTGTTIGGGAVDFNARAAPLADQPRFDLDLAITSVDLTALNDFLRAYSSLDVEQGSLEIFTEVTAADGAFEGYVKPLIEDLKFHDWSTEEQSTLEALWEQLVSVLARIVKNHPRDQLGTRVPFSGEFEDPEVGTWTAIGNTLRHGFIRAFPAGVEGDQSAQEADEVADSVDESNSSRNNETEAADSEGENDEAEPSDDESSTPDPPGLEPPDPSSRVRSHRG